MVAAISARQRPKNNTKKEQAKCKSKGLTDASGSGTAVQAKGKEEKKKAHSAAQGGDVIEKYTITHRTADSRATCINIWANRKSGASVVGVCTSNFRNGTKAVKGAMARGDDSVHSEGKHAL